MTLQSPISLRQAAETLGVPFATLKGWVSKLPLDIPIQGGARQIDEAMLAKLAQVRDWRAASAGLDMIAAHIRRSRGEPVGDPWPDQSPPVVGGLPVDPLILAVLAERLGELVSDQAAITAALSTSEDSRRQAAAASAAERERWAAERAALDAERIALRELAAQATERAIRAEATMDAWSRIPLIGRWLKRPGE